MLAGALAGNNVVILPRSGCCAIAKAPGGTSTLGEMDRKGCHWRELVALLRLLATPGWLKTPASLKRTMLTKPAQEVECRVRAHLLQSGNRRRRGRFGHDLIAARNG